MGSANNSLNVRKVAVEIVDCEVYRPAVSILSAKISELATNSMAPSSDSADIKISQPELADLKTEKHEHTELKTRKPEITELKTASPEEIKVTIKSHEEKPVVSPEASLKETISNANEAITRKRARPLWRTLLSGFSTALTAVFVLVAGALVGMKLAGFRAFTVMSGSMANIYPVGSLIYVKPVDYRTLSVGDVISYVANDEKTVVTHRIVNIEVDKNNPDVWRFQTKGDENSSPDARPVHYKNVLGTPIITLPTVGYFAHSIQQPPGIYVALVVGTLLLAWTFLPGTLEERRRTTRKSVA